jgi:hypothetical protein
MDGALIRRAGELHAVAYGEAWGKAIITAHAGRCYPDVDLRLLGSMLAKVPYQPTPSGTL